MLVWHERVWHGSETGKVYRWWKSYWEPSLVRATLILGFKIMHIYKVACIFHFDFFSSWHPISCNYPSRRIGIARWLWSTGREDPVLPTWLISKSRCPRRDSSYSNRRYCRTHWKIPCSTQYVAMAFLRRSIYYLILRVLLAKGPPLDVSFWQRQWPNESKRCIYIPGMPLKWVFFYVVHFLNYLDMSWPNRTCVQNM